MGCVSSKKAAELEEALSRSLHSREGGRRENLVLIRDDMKVTDVYTVEEIVGQGSMGEVSIVSKKEKASDKLAQRIKKSGSERELQALLEQNADKLPTKEISTVRKYACKTINTVRFNDRELNEFLNEIQILRELDHPNIIQLFEVFRRKRKLWIVMELCTGGDLTNRMDDMNEREVAIVMEQVTRAIAYMHHRDVYHRDIKLENILYLDTTPEAPIKLIDFGLSNKFTKGEKMLQACGTIYTAAPEVLVGKGQGKETDIWSIGCVCYILLSSEYPFLTDMMDLYDLVLMDRVRNAKLIFGPAWEERSVSQYGKDFCIKCLQKDPNERWSAKEALEYIKTKWMPNVSSIPTEITLGVPESGQRGRDAVRMDAEMVKGMEKFVLYGELKKTILMTMAYAMDKGSLHELREIFTEMDSTGSGTVTLVDLKDALKRMHSDKHLDDATIEKLFYGIDVDSSGAIHYNEFLAAVVESQGLITMEHLADAFDRLDGDEKGYISKEDLKPLLGGDVDEARVERMIAEVDLDRDGQIDYNEFLRLMFEDPESGLDVLGTNLFSASDADMVDKLAQQEPSRGFHVSESSER